MSENYRAILLDEHSWLRHADGLRDCAEALRPLVEAAWETRRAAARQDKFVSPAQTDAPIRVQMMLLAFAIENLHKASPVRNLKAEYERQLQKEAKLPKDLKSHNLVGLAIKARKAAGVRPELEDDEEDMLRRLSRRSTWQGRYPVAASAIETSNLVSVSNGKRRSVGGEGNRDFWEATRLIQELSINLHIPQPSRPKLNR